MSGVPLGFLISQFWWLFFDLTGGHYGGRWIRKRGEPYEKLVEEFEILDEKVILRAVYNYLIHSEKDEQIYMFLNRRWDMFLSLGSIATATAFGLLVGYILKYVIFNSESQNIGFNPLHDGIILLLSIILIIYLIIIIFKKILPEQYSMSILIIKKRAMKYKEKKLRTILPEQYFQSRSIDQPCKNLKEFVGETKRKKTSFSFKYSFLIASLIFLLAVCSDLAVKMFYSSEDFWFKIFVSLISILLIGFLIHIMFIFPFFRQMLSHMFGLEE